MNGANKRTASKLSLCSTPLLQDVLVESIVCFAEVFRYVARVVRSVHESMAYFIVLCQNSRASGAPALASSLYHE